MQDLTASVWQCFTSNKQDSYVRTQEKIFSQVLKDTIDS